MTHFNSFISELTTVYCVPDPRAIVWRCLYLSEESLVWTNKGGLSVCQPMASRGCQQHRVMLKLPDEYRHAEGINRFHLVSVHTSKVRTLQPTRTHSHIPAERFSPGSHPSHFVPQTHLWFAGGGWGGEEKKKNNKWATVQLGPAGVCTVSAWHQSWPKKTVFTVLSKYDPRYALCRNYEERCSAFNMIKSNKCCCIGGPWDQHTIMAWMQLSLCISLKCILLSVVAIEAVKRSVNIKFYLLWSQLQTNTQCGKSWNDTFFFKNFW